MIMERIFTNGSDDLASNVRISHRLRDAKVNGGRSYAYWSYPWYSRENLNEVSNTSVRSENHDLEDSKEDVLNIILAPQVQALFDIGGHKRSSQLRQASFTLSK